MQPTEEQVLRGLVHPNSNVRRLCRTYLAAPQRRTAGAMAALIQAAEQFGDDEILEADAFLQVQPQTAETLRWVLDFSARLARDTAAHADTCQDPDHDHSLDVTFRIGDLVATWDLDLLTSQSELLNNSSGVSFRCLAAIAERRTWLGSTAEEVSAEVERVVGGIRALQDGDDLGDRIAVLGEAWARHSDQLGPTWIEWLEQLTPTDQDETCAPSLIRAEIALAAIAKAEYRPAGRVLLDCARRLYDLHDDRTELVLLGIENALQALADEAFVTELWHVTAGDDAVRRFVYPLLACVPCEAALAEAPARLERLATSGRIAAYDDEMFLDYLSISLDARLIEPLRRVGETATTESTRWWAQRLVAEVAIIHDTPFEERDRWAAEALARDAAPEIWPSDLKPQSSVYYQGYPDIEPADAAWEDRAQEEDVGEVAGPALRPFRRPTLRVGRNDLCPCGSGKKYKKCCLRKEEAAF